MGSAAVSIDYTVGEPMPGTKWVVHGKLGQGGMGLVLDVVKARLIQGAMKVLLPPFARQPAFAARFLDEVKVTARLQHPNIVQVLDFDRLADGSPFMVMERLCGRTLRAALRETRQQGKAWTAANTFAVASQVSEGLYRAHSHVPSIVHRDVKPENVFLHRAQASFESIVKVMDFGVAAVVGESDRQTIGTPRYMAPEQVSGGEVSPQTDQYALALVIYEMLTGRLPWDVNVRDPKALAEVHRRVPPASATEFCPWLPARMNAAILKALSKDPSARHDTLHGLMFELRGLQWISDRSAATGDALSTDPMVGTLADGGAVVRDEHDTFARMSPPPEGPSLEVPGLTGSSSVSVQFSEPAVAPSSGPKVASEMANGHKELRPLPTPVRAEALDGRAATLLQSLETPMTGESGRPLESRVFAGVWPRGRRAASLVGAGLALAAVTGIGISRASRTESEGAAKLAESPASATGLPVGDAPREPARAAVDAIEAPDAGPEPAPGPPLASPTDLAEAKALAARPDGGPAWASARKAPALPLRAALRGPQGKAAVPDDGRDELYVPGAR